jgi:hypothetical protein
MGIARQLEGGEQVGLEDAAPLILGVVVGRLGDVAAGVVDQQVQAIGVVLDPVQDRLPVLVIGDVGGQAVDLPVGKASASSSRTVSSIPASRATSIRSAPKPASSRAMARPMPALAPVTNAVCPSNRQRWFTCFSFVSFAKTAPGRGPEARE